MRLLLCLRYGAGRYIMIKANFQALRLCALIIPAEIRVCIIAAKTRANIDHLYAALPHAGKINCPLPFAHINSLIKLRAGWRKRKSHHAQKGKQQNSAHQSTERSVTFFPHTIPPFGAKFQLERSQTAPRGILCGTSYFCSKKQPQNDLHFAAVF